MTILFLSTSDTARGPMAAALARRAFLSHGILISVRSAGLVAREGEPPQDEVNQAMQKKGIDISEHRAHLLEANDISGALILSMTQNHAMLLNTRFPTAKSALITELASLSGDVPDPRGGDATVYAACADALETLVSRIAERLISMNQA